MLQVKELNINPAAGDAPAPAAPAVPENKEEAAENGTTAPAAESEAKSGEETGTVSIMFVRDMNSNIFVQVNFVTCYSKVVS